jgi:hypothetical protein
LSFTETAQLPLVPYYIRWKNGYATGSFVEKSQ